MAMQNTLRLDDRITGNILMLLKSSDRNELTVKLHALLFKSKQCFTSGQITQRIDRKDLRMRMENMQY